VYDLEPDGLTFNGYVTVTIRADVTEFHNENQINMLKVYQCDDGVENCVPVDNADCVVDPEGTSPRYKYCEVNLLHFSTYAMVAPLDTDNDGVFDQFEDQEDNCPYAYNEMVPYALGDSNGECAMASFGVGVGDLWQPDYDCDGV
jgi:hypothetical protein